MNIYTLVCIYPTSRNVTIDLIESLELNTHPDYGMNGSSSMT